MDIGVLRPAIKRLEHEAECSPSSAATEVEWSYISTPSCAFMQWWLSKHRDNFTFAWLIMKL
jgi:hypothetical protein